MRKKALSNTEFTPEDVEEEECEMFAFSEDGSELTFSEWIDDNEHELYPYMVGNKATQSLCSQLIKTDWDGERCVVDIIHSLGVRDSHFSNALWCTHLSSLSSQNLMAANTNSEGQWYAYNISTTSTLMVYVAMIENSNKDKFNDLVNSLLDDLVDNDRIQDSDFNELAKEELSTCSDWTIHTDEEANDFIVFDTETKTLKYIDNEEDDKDVVIESSWVMIEKNLSYHNTEYSNCGTPTEWATSVAVKAIVLSLLAEKLIGSLLLITTKEGDN